MTNLSRYSLQDDQLSVEVLPHEGGRISSLRSVHTGLEFLAQSHRHGSSPEPGPHTAFQEGACAGIEECLPTVGPSGPETDGGPAPDHGDFWRLKWTVTTAFSSSLEMFAVGFSRTLRFSKKLSLEKQSLRIGYQIENIGSHIQSFLYACHPLFAVSAGDQILLPREVHELRLDYSRGERLGTKGRNVSWPEPQTGERLDIARGPTSGIAEMLYTGRLREGYCGIHRVTTGQILELLFDPSRLPYLGVWLCYGGWPEVASGPRQYAVALEPTTSGSNTLHEVQCGGSAAALDPGKTFDWELCFRISDSVRLF